MTSGMRVGREQWERAQEWELDFWRRGEEKRGWKRIAYPLARPLLVRIGSRRATGDDWNLWWRKQFDEYRFLPSDLGDYIELGCGPYTNTRLILENRTAKRIVCSDPLAEEYIGFAGRWLADAAKRGLVEIDSHPIEELPFPPRSFDVVVMINVLDHVMDARRCLETAVGLVRPGGHFILGQNLANPAVAGVHEWFEEGHPIRLTLPDIEDHLAGFRPVLRKTVPPNDPPLHTGILVFVGVRE